MTTTSFRDEVKGLLNDRLLDSAQQLTVDHGWSSVTMAKVAESAGVSRQTVYNEFGSKPELANALVMRELGRFLDVVRERLESTDDIVDAVRGACEGALSMAEDNLLIRAALSSTDARDADLIALLTTDSQLVLTVATAAVLEVIEDRFHDLPVTDGQLRMAADAIVRLVLSHITRPAMTPAAAANSIAWFFSHLVRP